MGPAYLELGCSSSWALRAMHMGPAYRAYGSCIPGAGSQQQLGPAYRGACSARLLLVAACIGALGGQPAAAPAHLAKLQGTTGQGLPSVAATLQLLLTTSRSQT
eukprot:1149945-Pelagomonas_calceolata.AAC.8